MPCSSARARILLSAGKAAVFRTVPFTIRPSATQPGSGGRNPSLDPFMEKSMTDFRNMEENLRRRIKLNPSDQEALSLLKKIYLRMGLPILIDLEIENTLEKLGVSYKKVPGEDKYVIGGPFLIRGNSAIIKKDPKEWRWSFWDGTNVISTELNDTISLHSALQQYPGLTHWRKTLPVIEEQAKPRIYDPQKASETKEKATDLVLSRLAKASAIQYINSNWDFLLEIEKAKKKLRSGSANFKNLIPLLLRVRNLLKSTEGKRDLQNLRALVPDDLSFGQGRIHTRDHSFISKLVQARRKKQEQ